MENSVVKDISLSQNDLSTFIFLLEKLILPLSDAQPAREILVKCTWRILGMPRAFPVCQHMEWGQRNNGPFHLLDSSAAQNIPPPLSWHWYHPCSFQKKSQLDGKSKNSTFSMVIPCHMQHSTALSLKLSLGAKLLPSAQVSHRSCVLAAWTKSFFIFKHNRKRHSQCNL